MRRLRRAAVLTSGGDAPGMNAAVRAVARSAAAHGIETYGVSDGYSGLLAGRLRLLDTRSVSGILHRGGTILGTARCHDFHTLETQQSAIAELERRRIGARPGPG